MVVEYGHEKIERKMAMKKRRKRELDGFDTTPSQSCVYVSFSTHFWSVFLSSHIRAYMHAFFAW